MKMPVFIAKTELPPSHVELFVRANARGRHHHTSPAFIATSVAQLHPLGAYWMHRRALMNLETKNGLLLVVGLLFVSHPSLAGNLMSASCSEPTGVRYDRVGEKIQRNDDGFSGVNPQFVFSKSNRWIQVA